MKEIKLYQCGICHTQYREKSECVNCEKNHKTDLEIIEQRHRPNRDDRSGFPIRIIVKDKKTGETALYTR